MNLFFKNNLLGYFRFYHGIIGNRIFLYLLLSLMISLMDGLGLAMFIPLLQFISNSDGNASIESLGQLRYVISFLEFVGLELNIASILMLIITLFFVKGCFKYLQLSYYTRIRQLFILKIRFHQIRGLNGLTYKAFLKLDSGNIQNTLTTEVVRLFQTMSSFFNSIQASVMLLTYVGLAFLANYQFAILVGLGSIISNLIYRKIYKVTKETSIAISKEASDFNGLLIQAIHYFKYLKSTNTFKIYSKHLGDVIVKVENLGTRIGKLKAIATSIKEPIIISVVCLVILVQVYWIGTGLNTIILSLMLFYRSLSYLVVLQTDWQGFIENIGAMHSIGDMSKFMSENQELQKSVQFNNLEQSIEFKDVDLYFENKKALDKINLQLPAFKTIALIGESGSGKTTIANMIAGMFEPNDGKILIDGTPLKHFDITSYRDKIGYISQEPVIFSDDIYNNITLWAEPTKENNNRFKAVLKMASLTDFVASLPLKENTPLGDNGILISGGQKQRISIARELFKDAEILILDEATSALDSETEKIIQENIEQLHGSRTMIVIAHRLSTIKEADIIYLIDNGRVSASGNFEEMMEKSSRFKKMVNLQTV